jgi:hypothetical protein
MHKTRLEGPIRDYLQILGASKEDLQDTCNSVRKNYKDLG